MNINNLNLELLASQRCSWIVKLENENVFLAGTDYPSKENFIIKYLLTENKLKVIEKQPIPNSSIYFNKIYNNNSIDIYCTC